jgi:paraquat-inducible protein B
MPQAGSRPTMADAPDLDALPQAVVTRRKRLRISIIWIIPLLAAMVAIGIAIQRVRSEGPTITIVFKGAEGIEAGKTFIRYKDVRIGLVSAVELSEDYSRVLVKAKIAKHAAGLMVADANFWVVEPRISLSGVSGLSTLLSGNYIGFQAGASSESQSSFVALDEPPIITDQPGRQYVLKTPTLGSLGVGTPIYYRRLNVGQVTGYALTPDGKSVDVTVFVHAPYDKYVTTNTRFWMVSGVNVTLDADGVRVRTESLAALLAGGVAFDLPEFATHGEPAPSNTEFALYRYRGIAMKEPDPVERRYVLHFNESVRGLSTGAPVTLYGLPVGEVTDVGLDLDAKTLVFRPRVAITFVPDRLIEQLPPGERMRSGVMMTEMSPEARLRMLRRIVDEHGLRAQLRTGSLLTGELYVAFEYFPDAPKVKVDWTRDPLELPVVPGSLASIEAKLGSILTKIDKLPLDAIGNDVRSALATLDKTLKDANAFVTRVDTELVPEGAKTLDELRRAIADAGRVIKNADATLFSKDSPAPQDLRDMLQEITRAARSVRVLVDYLERHPDTLLRGKPTEKP